MLLNYLLYYYLDYRCSLDLNGVMAQLEMRVMRVRTTMDFVIDAALFQDSPLASARCK